MTRTTAPAGLRPWGALLVAAALVAAACSSGKSALEAGNDDPPPTAAPVTADNSEPPPGSTPDDDAGQPPTSDEADDGDGDAVEATAPPATEPTGPTTTAVELEELPPCPVDALASADGPVEITFWHGLGNELETALNDVVDGYNANQDRVVVDLQNQVDYESIIDKYIQGSVNDRPDVVQLPEYIVQSFAQSDTFVPAEACVEASGFDTTQLLPGALTAYVFEGVQWAMPFNVSGPVLFYNRPMFAEAGLDPDDPPVSLEEWRAAADALVGAGVADVGIALDSGRDSGGGWFFEQWFGRAGEPYADNGNGRIAPATQVLFDNELGFDLLTYLQDLVNDGLAESVGDNAGGVDTFLKMIDEESPAAMTIATSAALSSVLAFLGGGIAPGLGPDDVGVGPMPGPSDVASAQVGGASLWIPAGKSDEVTAAVWDFITHLVDAQTQSTWSAATGYVPVHRDSLDLDPIRTVYTDDPRYRVAFDQLLAADDRLVAAVPALGPQREVRAQTADAIASVYAGGDVATIVADTAAAANALIANYNARN